MLRRSAPELLLLASFLAVSVLDTRAQPVETAGARALGMGGAFVGVADDASAVYWNPAGLAAGAFFGAAMDLDWLDWPRGGQASAGATPGGARTGFVGIATPPLGLFYLRHHEFGAGEDTSPIPETGPAIARLDTHQVGAAVLHTVLPGLAVGATLKFLRGAAGDGVAPFAATPEQVRDLARELPTSSSSAFDVDLGLHWVVGRASVGLVARNLARPSFEAPSGRELALPRHTRVGAAFRPTEAWLLAMDADLTIRRSATGEWRRVAAGVERWFAERKAGLRGGVRLNTVGDTAPAATLGGSLALRSGLWLEGQGAVGSSDAERGFGLALRYGW